MKPLDMKCSTCGVQLRSVVIESLLVDGAFCSEQCADKAEAADGEPNE